jgi:cytochrome bd-type quinol oxidase subunit 2
MPHIFYLVGKYLITALVVVVVSELAKRSGRIGGLVAALPLVTVLTLVWMQIETRNTDAISQHAWYTFWYVLPTLPMFLLLPWLLQRHSFWWALTLSLALTAALFVIYALALRRWGIDLWPG